MCWERNKECQLKVRVTGPVEQRRVDVKLWGHLFSWYPNSICPALTLDVSSQKLSLFSVLSVGFREKIFEGKGGD